MSEFIQASSAKKALEGTQTTSLFSIRLKVLLFFIDANETKKYCGTDHLGYNLGEICYPAERALRTNIMVTEDS